MHGRFDQHYACAHAASSPGRPPQRARCRARRRRLRRGRAADRELRERREAARDRVLAVGGCTCGSRRPRRRHLGPAVARASASSVAGSSRLHAGVDCSHDRLPRRRAARDGDLLRPLAAAACDRRRGRLRRRADRPLESGDDPALPARRRRPRIRQRPSHRLHRRHRGGERSGRGHHRRPRPCSATQPQSCAMARRRRGPRGSVGGASSQAQSPGVERRGPRPGSAGAAGPSPPALARPDSGHAGQPAERLPHFRALLASGRRLGREPSGERVVPRLGDRPRDQLLAAHAGRDRSRRAGDDRDARRVRRAARPRRGSGAPLSRTGDPADARRRRSRAGRIPRQTLCGGLGLGDYGSASATSSRGSSKRSRSRTAETIHSSRRKTRESLRSASRRLRVRAKPWSMYPSGATRASG